MMFLSEKNCSTLNETPCSDCPKAEKEWNMDSIFNDLAGTKAIQNVLGTADITDEDIKILNIDKRELTPTEKCWLGLLLSGLTPDDIARKLNREIRGLTSDFSRSLYKYVKILVKKKVSDWAQIILYLDQQGYRRPRRLANQKKLIRITIEFEVDSEEAENISRNTALDNLYQKYSQGFQVKHFYYEENE
ncbi:hypothetical protein [Microcoleus sp. D2_18a_D3]|uniref:hypothetical protein n=1 Tax=Microcoleus sp. D2_18a_D3 TaxID=3055330 RepID=UPI002FD10EA7